MLVASGLREKGAKLINGHHSCSLGNQGGRRCLQCAMFCVDHSLDLTSIPDAAAATDAWPAAFAALQLSHAPPPGRNSACS